MGSRIQIKDLTVEVIMHFESYYKKVYTAAYRLTGSREIAEELSELAISKTVKQLTKNFKATDDLLQLTILELIKIFINMSSSNCDGQSVVVQNALLKLMPVNRIVVVWKDVLGYEISSNIPLADYTVEELFKELVCGRRQLKEQISNY